MPLSNIAYMAQGAFVAAYAGEPATPFALRTIQGETPEALEAGCRAALDEMIALNDQIQDEFPEQFNQLAMEVADASIAGAGDGHTFIVQLTFVPAVLNLADGTLSAGSMGVSDMTFRFAVAGDSSEPLNGWNQIVLAAAADADEPAEGVQVFFQQTAGSSKGTRFMCMLGYSEEPTNADPPEA